MNNSKLKAVEDPLSFTYRFPEGIHLSPESEKRIDQWFRQAKFGAFIHFGLYSMLAGQYKNGLGKEHHYAEWIQASAKIPAEEYRNLATYFNPIKFDADKWCEVFKQAGMRYIVFTAKHHDGFALFKSKVSSFNIVDATPFGRDILRELADACRQYGLKLGIYYSHAQDWECPDAPILGNHAAVRDFHPELTDDFCPNMDRYLEQKALPQVNELLENYQPDLLWFDTPVGMTPARAEKITRIIREKRPDCLINSRIINRGREQLKAETMSLFDYVSIGDKEVPDAPLPVYFESPDSISSSYGYKKYGKVEYHSVNDMIGRLQKTIENNGNYLLNNGPMGDGQLDPEAIRIYQEIGKWLKSNKDFGLSGRFVN